MIPSLKIKTKFIILGAVGAAALSIIVFLAMNISKQGLESLNNVFKDSKQVQNIQQNYIAPIFYLRELSLSLVIAPNANLRKEIEKHIEPLVKDLEKEFEKMPDDIYKEWSNYKRLLTFTRNFIQRGFYEGAYINVNQEERQQFYKLTEKLQILQSQELKKTSQTFIEAKDSITNNRLFILIVSLVLGALLAILGWYIITKITNAITEIKLGHSRFYNFLKNKTIKEPLGISLDTDDELGDMAKAINLEMEEAKTAVKTDANFIENATNLVEEIKEGKLEKRLQVDANSDDLNILKSVINNMVDDLEHKIQDEINHRMDQEKLLIQQSKLAGMGNMIGNIAHQWRQPISEVNVILMELEMKARYGNDFTTDYMIQQIKECYEVTEYMSRTISDFQNFFKPSKSKKEFSIEESCSNALTMLSASLKFHNIEFSLNVEEDSTVLGYPNEFSQAILNILSNAKDALIERKVVSPEVKVTIKKGNKYALIQIQDNAGGITKENIERIFEPYFTTKHAKQGTGIGLYMTKMIIENNMNGFINVKNNDKGAFFTVKI